jgi:glutathione synthase
VHLVSLNTEFILKHLEPLEDDFTKRLINILKIVTKEGITQKIALGIHRSDYMIHQPEGVPNEKAKLLQVEINTISAAFGGLGNLVSRLHKFIIERHQVEGYEAANVSDNNATKTISRALAHAQSLHDVKDSIIMMIVNKNEVNSTDQRILEYKLWEDYQIRLIRRSLTDIAERGKLNDKTNDLTIDNLTVGVAYYRSGYKPEDYPTENEWEARLMVERSSAIKCPNISYHLVGSKKMQQVWSLPDVVEKFIFSPSVATMLRSCFAGQFSLDPQDNPENIISKVLENPSGYVMKPQREGGGNLLYDQTMVNALKTMSPSERASYIIMEKIVPPVTPTYVLLKNGDLHLMHAISEIGTYGVFIGNDKKTFINDHAGFLVRTKSIDNADGGVVAGVAVLDSIYQFS